MAVSQEEMDEIMEAAAAAAGVADVGRLLSLVEFKPTTRDPAIGKPA